MERMHSPWRSAYIQTFKEEKKEAGCLFCRIQYESDDRNNLVVARGRHSDVVMNRYPYNSGHLMVIPHRHTGDFSALAAEELGEVMGWTNSCIAALGKMMAPHGFNFGANIGRAAGAGIDEHIHFHLVPRWNGDTNFMPVLADVKLISEEMEKTYDALHELLKAGL